MLDDVHNWKPRAHLDRESIALYLGLECGSPASALALMRRIDEEIEKLRAFPDSGRRLHMDGLHHPDYRSVPVNPYALYFRFDNTTLSVYRILHQRLDIDSYSLLDLLE